MPAPVVPQPPLPQPRRPAPAAASAPRPQGGSGPASEPRAARLPRAELEAAGPRPGGLDEDARRAVERLAARDREVRAHEMAHVAAGRPWAGPPHYLFQRGPDGRRYAVAGHVAIDVSPVQGDPRATARKMRVVAEAALAPAEPSAADRRVADIARARLREALAALESRPGPALLRRL